MSQLRVTTLGPKGTHSETAARNYTQLMGCELGELSFALTGECLARVWRGEADLAVLPGENSVDGLIGVTYDALLEFHPAIRVIDQLSLPIEHVLAAASFVPPETLHRIYSHPSALNQCSRTLGQIAPGAELIAVGSTAEAAARIMAGTEERAAAVCSAGAAAARGLLVLRENIGDYPRNQTRFFICGRERALRGGEGQTLIAVHYGKNQPGQLYRTAEAFAARGVDLTSVHSRPDKTGPHSYILFFEATGRAEEPSVAGALQEIGSQVAQTGGWLKILGCFPTRSEA